MGNRHEEDAVAQTTSGKVLREARERKGYDLNTVARRLRIRPDILRAIEAGDSNAMPPRGYTRNMVNAYARLLGLNPTEIVNMYLDEAYAEQVERARDSGPSSGFNMNRETRRSRTQVGIGDRQATSSNYLYDDRVSDPSGSRQFSRILYDDGTRFARDDYGVTRERSNRSGKSDRDFSSHHSGYEATHYNFLEQGEQRRSSRHVYAGQTPMEYSASRLPAFLQSRAALIAIGVLVVAIIVVLAIVFLGGKNETPRDDVSQLPVSGITDTTGSGTAVSASASSAEAAPTSAKVVYSVASGNSCYVEIFTDGELTDAEELTGPVEKTVDVTGKWTITTSSSDMLKVTVDGQEVKLKEDPNYGGQYAYTVDFPAILADWKAKNTASGAQRTAASTAAAATTASSSSARSSEDDEEQSEEVEYDEDGNPIEDEDSEDEESDEESEDEESTSEEEEGSSDEE